MSSKGGKTTKKSSGKSSEGRQKKKVKDYTKFNTYITKVLKNIDPDTGISTRATMPLLNDMIIFIIDKVAEQCSELNRHIGHKTVTSLTIQNAVRLILPGELAKYAVAEGTKAVTKYNAVMASNASTQPVKQTKSKHKEHSHSKASRAGILFNPSRISKLLYSRVGGEATRKGLSASIYLAAVVEYLMAEVLELSGNASRDLKANRIQPRHVVLAVRNDKELSSLFSENECVLQGGNLPYIHREILPKKGKSKKSEEEED